MADARQIRELALLQRLMPPPPPAAGWGAARQQIEAQAVGVLVDGQAADAELQLRLNATQALLTGAWDENEFDWSFDVIEDQGATGRWLDAWGRVLSVPRSAGESDVSYGSRILVEIAHASCANTGMAKGLDRLLGANGTRVIDAATEVSPVLRANDGHQANIGLRANNRGRFLNTACCYLVRLAQPPMYYSVADIYWIVRRLQAAGTRLVLVQEPQTDESITITGPSSILLGAAEAFIADIGPEVGY